MNLTARIFFLTLASILTSLPLPVQFISAANAAPAVNTYEYDPNGNLTKSTDPLGRIRQYQHNPLDQPVRQLEPHPTVVGSTQGQIDIGYDSLGQLTSVTDPRNLTTQYQVDSLGNLTSQISPDTGTTTFTYDAAGNVKTRTNARNKTAVYSYDSLNRLSQAVYDSQTVTYSWDNCANGIGRLCSLANTIDSISYGYDSHGRITSKTQSTSTNTLTASYSYNAQGQWEQTATPSGQTIGYVWLNGKIDAITVNGQTLISQIGYEPDGQINGWTWGNGQQHERFYDLVGRPVLASLGFNAAQLPNSRHYGYDAAGRLIQMTDDSNPGLNQQHDYDGLDRLTGSERGEPAQSRIDYSYDLNGNRTSKIVDNTTTYNYNISASNNRLQSQSGAQAVSYSYDKMGLLVSDGTHSYSYNPEGRRTSVIGVVSYGYNALGQRVKKNVIGGPFTRYFYDEQGHLAGEYNASGQLLQEIVWLGDLPVAVLRPTVPVSATVDVYYIHADTLGTPRQISRPGDNKVVWAWESEAFGDSLPEQNPSGLGTFVFNLRFPGQYYDAETGLHYNVFRDYDPRTGRYSQSDPIGLAGGLNTYAYVGNNPVNDIDPTGEAGKSNPRSAALWCLLHPKQCTEYAKKGIEKVWDGCKWVWQKVRGGSDDVSDGTPKIEIPRSKYPEGAKHVEDAQAAGHPSRLTIDRAGTASNRSAAQAGQERQPGMDLDEYPPAMFSEGGAGASVRPMTRAQNRGMGACIGNQCRGLPDGTQVDIVVK